jgi:hypothetical protein
MDTGAANEHVPLNDQGYLLPLYMVRAVAQALSPALHLLQCWLSYPRHHCSGCRHMCSNGLNG